MTKQNNVVLTHTSPRSCGRQRMQGIGAARTLYPAYQPCGMIMCVRRGFTLIELLVVVLIIGILSAVALPQYQKAVAKAQFQEIQTLGRTLRRAQDLYRLEHGNNTPNVNELLISIPTNKHFRIYGNTVWPGGDNEYYNTIVQSTKIPVSYILRFYKKTGYSSACWQVNSTNDVLKRMADKFAGKTGNQYSYYSACE